MTTTMLEWDVVELKAPAGNGLALTFVSGDWALLAAAQAERLPTANPFDHVSPLDTPS